MNILLMDEFQIFGKYLILIFNYFNNIVYYYIYYILQFYKITNHVLLLK